MTDRHMGVSASKVVHIVDSDAAAAASASSILVRGGYAVQVWEDATAFLAATRLRTDECALLDAATTGDAAEVQRQLRAREANIAVVMTGAEPEIGVVIRAMKEGAVDFLLKPFEEAALLDAAGEAFRRIARRQARSQPASLAERKLRLLSTRERQVLRGLTDGLSNKEIAIELNISPRTVEIHRANLMAKLEARSLSGALQIAFAAGIARPAAHQELLAG